MPGDPEIRPVIRRAVRADGPALSELDYRTWSTLHAVTPAPPGPTLRYFDKRHTPDRILIADLPELRGPAGYIRVVPPTDLAVNAHVRQIQGLAVAPETRGRGVARALLAAAAAESLRLGARRLTLRVLGHNTPARRLYESAGFVVEGVLREEFLIAGEYVDDVFMARTLNSPA